MTAAVKSPRLLEFDVHGRHAQTITYRRGVVALNAAVRVMSL
jgi:hypothetical protein